MKLARLVLWAPFAVVACGGGETPPPQTPSSGGDSPSSSSSSSSASPSSSDPSSTAPSGATPVSHVSVSTCGTSDKTHKHDLNSTTGTEALVPCAQGGKGDFAGLIKIETLPEGVHIIIHATDDQVDLGMLGSDAKTRDAVIVYPRGKGSKAIEVPLMKAGDGYDGDRIVLWEDLDKLTDDGTKLDIAVYDHDKAGEASEEMHVSVAVSTGKSCEKAQDENPQSIDMGKKGSADLSAEALGKPMSTSQWFASCGLPDSANADICVAVKNGKPLGVSVGVTPDNKRVAACIDRSARKLSFPVSDKLDVVHQKF